MTVFWNEGVEVTRAGLDIVGVRGADQAHEARLTGGITTISARARYLALLPWFLDEWYSRSLESGRVRHNPDAQGAALRRLEKVVLLATIAGGAESDDTRAVLGSDLWDDDIKAIGRGQVVDLSSDKGGASFGTYVQPCIQLGLLLDGAPVGVPRAGREIASARRTALVSAPIVEAIFRGGSIDRATAIEMAPHFSINQLSAPESAQERQLLSIAVTTAAATDSSSLGLDSTLRWVLAAAADHAVSPATLISDSFRASLSGDPLSGPPLAYAQYELLRRVHFALELCLAAIWQELGDVGPRDIAYVARKFSRSSQQDLAAHAISSSDGPLSGSFEDFVATLSDDTLDEQPLVGKARNFVPAGQAGYALALLVAAARAVTANPELRPRENGAARAAIAIVEGGQGRSVAAVLSDILVFVADRHLVTTFRKMAAGLPCSLRFVSDGRRLHRTELSTAAGMSGHRLTNVMTIASDLGFLARGTDGFSLTARGRALLGERQT